MVHLYRGIGIKHPQFEFDHTPIWKQCKVKQKVDEANKCIFP